MPNPTSSLRSQPERAINSSDYEEQALIDRPAAWPRRRRAVNGFKRPNEGPALVELGRWLTRTLAIGAVLSCVALLAVGATPLLTVWESWVAQAGKHGWSLLKAAPLAAFPLLLAGSSYVLLQAIVRPRPLELLKRLMLGSAFLLWGITELMPSGPLATELGNLVIALYVVDLGLMINTDLRNNAEAGGNSAISSAIDAGA
jgi:hypothetical protein